MDQLAYQKNGTDEKRSPKDMTLLEKMNEISIEFGPGLKDIQSFTNQLAVMLRAGINIRDALDGVATQVENKKFREVLMDIRNDVEAGSAFSDALAKHPKVFSDLYVNMIRASELSGGLSIMLERLSKYLDSQLETRSMVRGAMVYPIIIAVMAVVTTIFMLTFVLPRFTLLFVGKESLLPKPTIILMAMSDFLRNRWYIVIGVAILFFVSLTTFLKNPKGKRLWDKFKLKMPVLKGLFSSLYISRSMHTIGELLCAGVGMLETLEITARISGNSVYEDMWMEVHSAVKRGQKLSVPLEEMHVLPTNVIQMTAAGEESGKLGDVLQEVAEFYQRELKASIKTVTSMIEPLMIVVMGFVVGFIAMSVTLPIFKMSQIVKGG